MLEVGLIVIDLVPENNAIQTDLQKDFNFDSFDWSTPLEMSYSEVIQLKNKKTKKLSDILSKCLDVNH